MNLKTKKPWSVISTNPWVLYPDSYPILINPTYFPHWNAYIKSNWNFLVKLNLAHYTMRHKVLLDTYTDLLYQSRVLAQICLMNRLCLWYLGSQFTTAYKPFYVFICLQIIISVVNISKLWPHKWFRWYYLLIHEQMSPTPWHSWLPSLILSLSFEDRNKKFNV